jgi:hypothetical protein
MTTWRAHAGDCDYDPAGGRFKCLSCGHVSAVLARRNCPKKGATQHKPRACPLCLRVLTKADRKQLGRDGNKWHWWCPACKISCGECRTCNEKSNTN